MAIIILVEAMKFVLFLSFIIVINMPENVSVLKSFSNMTNHAIFAFETSSLLRFSFLFAFRWQSPVATEKHPNHAYLL